MYCIVVLFVIFLSVGSSYCLLVCLLICLPACLLAFFFFLLNKHDKETVYQNSDKAPSDSRSTALIPPHRFHTYTRVWAQHSPVASSSTRESPNRRKRLRSFWLCIESTLWSRCYAWIKRGEGGTNRLQTSMRTEPHRSLKIRKEKTKNQKKTFERLREGYNGIVGLLHNQIEGENVQNDAFGEQ